MITHIEVDSPYDSERKIDYLLNILGGEQLITLDKLTEEQMTNLIANRFNDTDKVDKTSIVIEKLDNVYRRALISYNNINDSYRYRTNVDFDDLFTSVKES